eukprot:366070-Chlamydomonas_euryale.AAC.7
MSNRRSRQHPIPPHCVARRSSARRAHRSRPQRLARMRRTRVTDAEHSAGGSRWAQPRGSLHEGNFACNPGRIRRPLGPRGLGSL